MDAGLRRRVALHLATRIGLLDDGADRRPILHGDLSARRATGHSGIDDRLEEARLAAEGAIDRLHPNAGLARDDGHRHGDVAVIAEQRPGRGDDVATRLRRLLGADGRPVSAAGLDILDHFVRMILASIRIVIQDDRNGGGRPMSEDLKAIARRTWEEIFPACDVAGLAEVIDVDGDLARCAAGRTRRSRGRGAHDALARPGSSPISAGRSTS